MFKISPRKIAAIIFFMIIIGFSFMIFYRSEFDLSDRNIVISFIGIFFSALVLLILNLTDSVKKIKHVYTEDSVKREEIKPKESISKDAQETEKYIVEILQDLGSRKDIKSYTEKLLTNFASSFHIVQGIFYIKNKVSGKFSSVNYYAFYPDKDVIEFEEGEGLNGQAAVNKEINLVTDVADGYIKAVSGLGSSSPNNLLIIPFVYNGETVALVELAAFEEFPRNISQIYQAVNKVISENILKFL